MIKTVVKFKGLCQDSLALSTLDMLKILSFVVVIDFFPIYFYALKCPNFHGLLNVTYFVFIMPTDQNHTNIFSYHICTHDEGMM